jgi:NADH dehydrogenase
VGSQSNDFGTPGVREHALKLETAADARRFHTRMVHACVRAQAQQTPLRPEQLKVAIIGAGATGVELSAELHHTMRQVVAYGLDRVDAERDIKVVLIEAGPRVLPALPERLSRSTERCCASSASSAYRRQGRRGAGRRRAPGRRPVLPAELTVWAAGVKAAEFLTRLDGLETNRINQLLVRQTLQTTLDDDIFALGDCAACPWPEKNGFVRHAPRPPTSRPRTCSSRSAAASTASRCRTTATAISARWSRSASSAPSAT